MTILRIKDLSKAFDDNIVVNDISLDITQGEFFTLLGPSGCGKTTLLRMIAGFVYPDSGSIFLDNIDITNLPPEKRPLHTVFQSYALFPHMSVFENIAFPLKMAKKNTKAIKERVEQLLEDVRLGKYAKRYPHELSGGQAQRVAIARSLANKPKLLLLDEPLSALDARLREHMHVELVKLQEGTGVTFIYVTHDQTEALALSSRVAVMNLGKIEQLNKPHEVYNKPSTYFVADFLGKCNLLQATIIDIKESIDSILINPQLINNEINTVSIINEIDYNASLPVKHSKIITLQITENFIFDFIIDDDNDAQIYHQVYIGYVGWYSIRPEKLKAKKYINANDDIFDDVFCIDVVVKSYYYYGESTLYEFLLDNGVKIQAMLANNKTKQAEFFVENTTVPLFFDPQAGNFLLC